MTRVVCFEVRSKEDPEVGAKIAFPISYLFTHPVQVYRACKWVRMMARVPHPLRRDVMNATARTVLDEGGDVTVTDMKTGETRRY